MRRCAVFRKNIRCSFSSLLTKLNNDIGGENLKADVLIRNLFKSATRISSLPFVEVARLRFDIGNPPGKEASLGDAINWETLLAKAPNSEPLHFVTDDGDYSSPLNSEVFLPFLSDEYQKVKKGRLKYYRGFLSSSSAISLTYIWQAKLRRICLFKSWRTAATLQLPTLSLPSFVSSPNSRFPNRQPF